MIGQHHLSERRERRLVGLSRDAYRHSPVASALNAEPSGKMVELAHLRRRFGYRRIHDLLLRSAPDSSLGRIPQPSSPSSNRRCPVNAAQTQDDKIQPINLPCSPDSRQSIGYADRGQVRAPAKNAEQRAAEAVFD